MTDTAPTSLQESILAVLVFDERAGAAVAAQVLPQHFDESYREIAEKVLAYRRKYGRGPGRAHLDDLFDKRLQDNNRPSRVRRLLMDLAGIAPELNAEYVLARTQRFVREQQLKAALVEGNSRWEQGGDDVAVDLEGILHKALKHRATSLDAGTFLGNERALRFLDRDDSWGISYGISQLDDIKLSMRPKEMTLYIGGKGTGKTWACVNVGKQGIKAGRKVLHITNEMSEELIAQRYLQSLLAAATHSDKFIRTTFEFNRKGSLIDMPVNKRMQAERNILAPDARKFLRQEMKKRDTIWNRLVIKEFPSGSLTLSQLEAYLDFLEQEHKFHPNLLIIDYPDLMAQDAKNYRISLGRTFVGVRGILVDRHMAGFCPTQGNRSSLRATKVSTDMVAEDISKLHTADTVLTYSRTEAEKERNLARLFVGNARNQRDGAVILLSQSYDSGQYVIDSTWMQQSYWDILKAEESDEEV